MKQLLLFIISLLGILSGFAQEFTWKNVNNQGMGYVTGMVIHPDIKNATDLIYARTDVGGAYRFDPANQKWIQLMDFASSAQSGYFRVESIAIDPSNPEKVYVAVDGSNGGGGDILFSTDRGTSWKTTGFTVKNVYIAGNDPWRGSSGERLMVDPNNADIIYFASRKNGLWKKEGASGWIKVAGGLPATAANPGFTFVLFDKTSSDGQKSKTIYAGCSGSGTWKSEDSGANWTNLEGGTNCLRANLAPDSTLYVTYGGHEQEYQGPGKVAKFKNGTWTTITPPSGTATSYSGICTDPTNANVVTVTTHQRSMYYSKNKGANWTRISSKFSYYPPYYNSGENSFNWGTAALVIDPNNIQRLWSTNGYAVIRNDNYTLPTSTWTTVMHNFEELCAIAISTPPLTGGADLFTIGMDMVGMRNASRNIVPTNKIATFQYVSRGTSMEYCQTKPEHIVFLAVAQTNETDSYHGYSTDNGLTWSKFNVSPGKGGKLVMSATNEKNWVWTPDKAQPQFTLDAGKTWTPCKGIARASHESGWAAMSWLAADKINGNKFYFTDNGKLYYSEDGGANWKTGWAGLPGWPHKMFLKAHPYREGELWYAAMPNSPNPQTKIFVSKDGGKSFSILGNMVFANNIAFGKGDNDSIPFVYMTGKVDKDGPEGIFKSEDEGKTWKLITDPEVMQLAIVLEGDMRYKNLVYTNGGSCRGVIYGSADLNVGNTPETEIPELILKVYPNPTQDLLVIEAGEEINSLAIYNLEGKKLKIFKPENSKQTISLTGLKQGCYLLRVATKSGYKVVEIIKN
jgi:photosystem II stability/assembly factor-like uncharacterized protein